LIDDIKQGRLHEMCDPAEESLGAIIQKNKDLLSAVSYSYEQNKVGHT